MLVLIIPCVLCFVYAWRRHRKYVRGRLPPIARRSWPIIGLAHLWIRGSFWKHLLEIQMDCLKRGCVTLLHAGIRPIYSYYAICDPEDCERVNQSTPEKVFLLEDSMKTTFGNSLLTASGWSRYRNYLEKAFLELCKSTSLQNKEAESFVSDLAANIGKGQFDATPYVQRSLMRVMLATLLGDDQGEVNNLGNANSYIDATEKLSTALYSRHKNMFTHKPFVFNLTKNKRLQDEALNELKNLLSDAIIKRKILTADTDTKSSCGDRDGKDIADQITGPIYTELVDAFLELENQNVYENEEDLYKELIAMLFSGYMTMKYTMLFLLNMLALNSKMQERIYEEFQDKLTDTTSHIGVDQLSKLIYLDAFIMETLRMYPAVTTIAKKVDKKVKLKKYTMDPGTNCLFFIYALNHHPVWGEAKDSFNPDRWLTEEPITLNSFASFGLGHRGCIGKQLAKLVLKVFLIHLLRQYTVLTECTEIKIKHEIFLSPCETNISLYPRS